MPQRQHLHRPQLRALFSDLLGVVVGGLVDLQQPGGLRQRLQGVDGLRALQLPLLQPLVQVADVAPGRFKKKEETNTASSHLFVPAKKKQNSNRLEKVSADLICIPFLQEHMSLRSMMLLRATAPTRKNICLTTWWMRPCSMPCWLMVEWRRLSCWMMEEMVWASESSSSFTLLERFLKPVGFMLEMPCRLSCSSMPGTARETARRNYG